MSNAYPGPVPTWHRAGVGECSCSTEERKHPLRTISRPAPMRATPEQKEQVVHITWGSQYHRQWQGTLTGIIVLQDDEFTLVQMFSAGCVHNIVAIPTPDIIQMVPYGH